MILAVVAICRVLFLKSGDKQRRIPNGVFAVGALLCATIGVLTTSSVLDAQVPVLPGLLFVVLLVVVVLTD